MAYAQMTAGAAHRRHGGRTFGPILQTAAIATLLTTVYCLAKLLLV